MLEGLVAWVLNNYLGKYVENLNTDQLSIALLSGEVELENLPLRKDALRHIGLPIEVRAGFIGKVKLQIPVRQIRSAPWVIVIEQLYLVSGPVRLSEWDSTIEEQVAQELKQSALDASEAKWRAESETAYQTGYYASSYSSWVNYGTGLMTNIVENLQLKIKDVHYRYEDDVTVPGTAFACGITIESLSAQSCDSTWVPGFTQYDTSSASFKLLLLNSMATYWDALIPPAQLLGTLSMAELAVAMGQGITSNHKYIMRPVTAQAHIKRDRTEQPLRSRYTPRIVCDLTLDEVALTLTDWQYDEMIQCVRGLDDVARLRRYRLFRPSTTVKENVRSWWVYAIRSMIPGRCPSFCLPRPTWQSCQQKAKENVKYVEICAKMLATPTAALGTETKALKDRIEWNRELDELTVLREIAMRRVPIVPSSSTSSQGRSMLVQWFPQWWGWYSPAAESNSSESLESPPQNTAQSPKSELEHEILDALADTFENNTILRRDTVFGQFNFTLKQGTFHLCTAADSTSERISMMELQYENVKLSIETRPRTSSYKFEIILGALYLHDRFTHESQFPVLISPQGKDQGPSMSRVSSRILSPRLSRTAASNPNISTQPLFQLCYEQKPFNSSADYKLHVRSQSLDIVYNPGASQWLATFLAGPHQQRINLPTRSRIGADLIRNWEQILEGDLTERQSWELQLDISAPQIILVEQFTDRNAAVVVVDFGRLQLTNFDDTQPLPLPQMVSHIQEHRDSEDDDNFMTPCSTPPGSEASDSEPQTMCSAIAANNQSGATINELSLHQKLYDRYTVELNDLQILVGKVRDNWKYAHTKGSSTLHVLDRFNISFNIERRAVYTADPSYPSLTLNANLPKLVVHVNEQKIATIRKLYNIIVTSGLPSPFRSPQNTATVEKEPDDVDTDPASVTSESITQDITNKELARLVILQFSIDHMALEVQSRGRSVAELQVAGVRAAFTQRHCDTSISLSVHGLLLVDALQTFGPDFELLIASHKHVGMDSVSGSLRDSEPCSPTSPGSPDPSLGRTKVTSPIALTQALSTLTAEIPANRAVSPTRSFAASPPPGSIGLGRHQGSFIGLEHFDADALITVEVLMITGSDPLQHANIQFNNLDIIANQETIVELMGFARRVFPQLKPTKRMAEPVLTNASLSQRVTSSASSNEAPPQPECIIPSPTKTEIIFDFHRLNVLLLRAVVKDGCLQGRKIATATMSEARIQATVDNTVVVEGSLGGLQVLDLTPEGHMHQRIISVGKDPLVEDNTPRDILTTLNAELYTMGQPSSQVPSDVDRRAFSFSVKRLLHNTQQSDKAEITVRMASVWYTHSPQFVMELQSCASEFKQYLTNLARSIKTAATDMAMGLVHARAEALAQSLYINSRLSTSLYGVNPADIMSPRRRKRSYSQSSEHTEAPSGYASGRGTTPHTPYSPTDDDDTLIDMKLDVILDSPVVVLPRTANSPQVFVAHLGKITVNNNENSSSASENGSNNAKPAEPSLWDSLTTRVEKYNIDVRDMNLYSLDTSTRRMNSSQIGICLGRAEELYSCTGVGYPILHDTMLRLTVERKLLFPAPGHEYNSPVLLGESEVDMNTNEGHELECHDNIQISGCVVTPLKLSMTRSKYEQLLATFETLIATYSQPEPREATTNAFRTLPTLGEDVEDDTGVTTLSMDPTLRARMFNTVKSYNQRYKQELPKLIMLKVAFKLPEFTIELRGDMGAGEQGLVDLSFRDFNVDYEKFHRYETNVQVSLRSLVMEDLSRPPDSKYRYMVVSSATNELPLGPCYLSRSCPDLIANPIIHSPSRGSLPDHLETGKVLGLESLPFKPICPRTPPPSPSRRQRPHDNLVLISSLIVDPSAPNFSTHYNSLQRSTSVDFNCLDLVVSVESWVVVLDFFGADSNSSAERKISTSSNEYIEPINDVAQDFPPGNSELAVEVRSLTLVLTQPEREVARANISNLSLSILNRGSFTAEGATHPSSLQQKSVSGRLGSMSLLDLTPHGTLYKERFVSAGEQALNFNYIRLNEVEAATASYDAQLGLEMSSVLYVHTKRFVNELQSFFMHFSQLQSVMSSIRAATRGQVLETANQRGTRLILELHAGAPVILLPVSSRSTELLVADLGKLKINNRFCLAGSEGTISSLRNSVTDSKCLLNVMSVDLVNMDLYTAQREPIDRSSPSRARGSTKPTNTGLELGGYRVAKEGPSLLTEKCHLKLQIEHNLDAQICHDVADMSVHGTLSTLDGALDLSQYKLIRGLLAYNLGEVTIDLLPSTSTGLIDSTGEHPLCSMIDVWRVWSLRLDLLNVTVRLLINHGEPPLARINFIKSKLTVESFSDSTQDVDLVSQEIQLIDSRFNEEPVNKRSNMFTNILQPIHTIAQGDSVQAEIHSRKRHDHSKFTILLNNMRLMGILDWWEAVRDFILGAPEPPPQGLLVELQLSAEQYLSDLPQNSQHNGEIPFELKLNITDSEVVIVEDTSQWDTNAVILKSTTVISYRPSVSEKPLSCNLNHCEMFSCVLGMEEETALSIIDPVTVNMEVNKERILEVSLQHLSLRLSYHDMMMFIQMMNSIPKQTQWAKSHHHNPPANAKSQIAKLSALGFAADDCSQALDRCKGQLDDAALWLTQHATAVESPVHSLVSTPDAHSSFKILAVEIKMSCLSLCIIDDCRDSDVPLLELSFSHLNVRQAVGDSHRNSPTSSGAVVPRVAPSTFRSGDGWLECVLAGDYYNRVLSGWEPFIEAWKCEIGWDYSLTASLQRNRLQLRIQSDDLLKLNITSTLVDLYRQVRDTWTQDYYNTASKESIDNRAVGSPPGYRRRSPFVPFALKNETGSKLWFTTLITTSDNITDREKSKIPQPDNSWVEVVPGDTIPFTFEGRGKLRHRDTHKLRIHQLGVKIDGWRATNPISVDKVGVYFRHASPEIQRTNETARARVVFAVALEGTARKLVTVRSALILTNELPDLIELKLDNAVSTSPGSLLAHSKTLFLPSHATLPIPLSHVNAQMFLRPIDSKHAYMYSSHPLRWTHINRPGEIYQELRECRSQRHTPYRFCVSIRRELYPIDRGISMTSNWSQPAHTLVLRPPIILSNLLPHELHYAAFKGPKGRIQPGAQLSLHELDMDHAFEISLHLDNFPSASTLVIPTNVSSFNCRIRLEDHARRRLFLNVAVTMLRGSGMEIVVTAPYWIINKTGIPLVFRQEGVATETAGQFEEHEIARMVAPLLFSLADPDASPTVVARVGNGVTPAGSPQWCHHFHLQPGMQTRKLRVSLRGNRPDVIYVMGVDVRTGRGRYRDTNIVTVSPRYQLHNKSSYQLQFSQKCFATTLKDPGAQATYLRAVPNCHMAFHWPRLDREQLLCTRMIDVPDCCWSGGLQLDSNYSLHVNVRDVNGRMYFLRLDVVLQGATFFIVFTDADTMPPPIRVDNYSEVVLSFAQTCCKDSHRCTARAHASVPYALDEPTQSPNITVMAPGGVTASYDMNLLGEGRQLTYENFIYIAFIGTFKHPSASDPLDIESQQLVLDVGPGGRIILAWKQPGQRSQLWRMSSSGQLIHEGSSPPRPPQQPQSDKSLVLDIEAPAPQPSNYTGLMLRRPDPRRQSTQTWRFTDEGRLCCAHSNMCVQAKDGFFGLRSGSAAVLGMINQNAQHGKLTEMGIPLEQAVGRQRLRPGSGYLKLEVTTDGPTRVLKVYDIKEKRIYAMPEERDWASIAITQRPNLLPEPITIHKDSRELQITVQLSKGVGVSIVSRRPPEELMFAYFRRIIVDTGFTPTGKTFDVSVGDIQCDNQLFEAPNAKLIHVTKPSRADEEKMRHLMPALHISAEIQSSPNENAVIFKHLIVSLKPLAIYLEERLILKIFAFAGYSRIEQEPPDTDESDFETQRILTEVTATHAKRYYFGIIKLVPSQIRLSMLTASKLPTQLQTIKRKLGLTLIKFEDAAVDLEPFVKQHPFESIQFLVHSILKHFRDELMWQAANILGSVDFLGNPLGFVNDVSEGVSGLIYEGSVGALVKNVTHGISNSAAKVTESLSDGLGKVTMDEEHEEMRLRIRSAHAGSSGAHLVAGVKGLGFGLLGGATGIFKQIYEGASNEGIQGVFSGFGKGLVGAVTKPVVGVLDLASETARAVRDSSRSSSRATPPRYRPPRCVVGIGGLLPLYSKAQALGQQHLHALNNRDYSELLVAYESLRGAPEDLRIIVSSEHVRIVTSAGNGSLAVVIETHLSDLILCSSITTHESHAVLHYIELAMRVAAGGGNSSMVAHAEPVRRPRIRCDSESLARWVSQQVNYAKSMYEERLHTLVTDVNTED